MSLFRHIDEDTNAEWRRDDYIPPTPQIYDEDRTRLV